MLTNQNVLAALLLWGAVLASPANAEESYQLRVEALSLAGAPLGTQTAECSLLRRCGVFFPPREGEELGIRISVTEKAPGVLVVRADQGIDTLDTDRIANERGTVVELNAVRHHVTAPDEPLMTFRVTWE